MQPRPTFVFAPPRDHPQQRQKDGEEGQDRLHSVERTGETCQEIREGGSLQSWAQGSDTTYLSDDVSGMCHGDDGLSR